MAVFPSEAWLTEFVEKLNSDQHYAQVAQNWEGDMNFIILPSGKLTEQVNIYLDLWHGKCRQAFIIANPDQHDPPVFTLQATYDNYVRILKGEVDPMQAMLTRKLNVKGNMAYMLRNVPVVLDFVRCLREVTDTFL